MENSEVNEAPDLSESYTSIKKDLLESEQQQDEALLQSNPPDPQVPDPQVPDPPSRPEELEDIIPSDVPAEKPKRKPRQRKDILCDTCGKTYSSKTKNHKCVPPTGFVKVSPSQSCPTTNHAPPILPDLSRPREPEIYVPPPPPPAQREITIDDVRGFLVKEKAAKTEHRRNTWISSLF